MYKICGFYISYFSIELKRGSSKTNVLPLTKRQGVFLIVTTFSICWLQFFLSIMLGLNINFSCARYYLHAHAPHFYVYDNCQEA